MNRRLIGAAVAAAILAGLGWYAVSPLVAMNSLQSAMKAGDADRLERLVDFPAVRDSLKTSLTTAMNAHMSSDPEMANNPFAGMFAMMIPAMINQAVDAYVTADGLAKLADGQAPREGQAAASTADPVETKTSVGYRDLDTFVSSTSAEGGKPVTFVMKREGLFDWELKRIELPSDLLDQGAKLDQSGTPAQ